MVVDYFADLKGSRTGQPQILRTVDSQVSA